MRPSDSQILNTMFEGNGDASVFDHNIYLSGSNGGETRGIRIIGNRLYRSAQGGTGRCGGVSLVVHGEHRDLLVEANEVWEDLGTADPTCWGIAIDPGYSSPEAFYDVVVRGNIVRNVGNLAIGMASVVNGLIENNVIIQENSFGFRAIAAPNRSAAPDDLVLDQITVRNNSIWIVDAPGHAIALGGSGANHVVVSNAIQYRGSDPRFSCFGFDLPLPAYLAIDNNVCDFALAPGAEWSFGHGTSPDPLSAWRLSGFGAASQNTDPGYVDAAGGNLNPTAGSPLIDQGQLVLSSPIDHTGAVRDAFPDVGAYEALGCAILPGEVLNLHMFKSAPDSTLAQWNTEPSAGSYRLYEVDMKPLIPTANAPLVPACDTTLTSCMSGVLSSGVSPLFYEILGVCAGDPSSEGPH